MHYLKALIHSVQFPSAHLEGSVHGRGQQQMAEVLHWTPLKRVHWTLMGLNVALHASGQLNPTVPSAQKRPDPFGHLTQRRRTQQIQTGPVLSVRSAAVSVSPLSLRNIRASPQTPAAEPSSWTRRNRTVLLMMMMKKS